VGERGALRAILEVQGDHIAVTLWDKAAKDPLGKILGTEEAPIDDSYAQAKEKVVLLIARELTAHTDEEWDRIRKDIVWTQLS